METKEGNILINGFMGKKLYPTQCSALIFQTQGNYHKTWDWLMPVIIKINQINAANLNDDDISRRTNIGHCLGHIGKRGLDLETTWGYVVDFLVEYSK